MKKKKATQTTTTANTFQYMTPPETADVTALRGMKATTDPTIPYTYAGMRQQNTDSFNNPLGSYTTPAVREAAERAYGQRSAMDESQAIQNSQYNADNTNYARSAGIASMTAPQLVQTGGTQTGVYTPASNGFFGDLISGAYQNVQNAGNAIA